MFIRSPQVEDAQKFIDYCHKLFATSPYVTPEPDEYKPEIDKQKLWIQEIESNPTSISIIAEFKNEIIGNIDFRTKSTRRKTQHRGDFGMGIVKEWQGKGVGRVLLKNLIEWAKDKTNPVEKIELGVIVENIPAYNLYRSFGFKEEGRITKEFKTSDGRYLDGYIMGLWLDK